MFARSPRRPVGPLVGLPRTILVVDDDASLRSALESVLTPMGYRVVMATDGDSAYSRLATDPADAVLMDLRLPGMSGFALYLAVIHRWPQLEGRIAFMTGDADAPDVRVWAERGGHTTFRKPFSIPQITAWLALVLQAPTRANRQA
jgi:DNA-binding response OmpR family regulator